ncbi:MAG TPA: phosphatase PAP2 family protein [Gemmatimonadales bacterium]
MSSAPRIRRRATAAARAIVPARESPPTPPATLLAVAAGGLALLVASALADSSPARAAPLDRHLRRLVRARFRDRLPEGPGWWPALETRRHRVAESAGGLAGDWTTLAACALAALAVARRRGPATALPVLVAAQIGNSAHGLVKYRVERPRPLTARLTGKHTPSFPSGHAARGAAMAGILAYVAAREGVLAPRASLSLGTAVALAGGGGRLYVDRHWATDALGGWGLGAAVAALCAIWYDVARERRSSRDAGERGDVSGTPRASPPLPVIAERKCPSGSGRPAASRASSSR